MILIVINIYTYKKKEKKREKVAMIIKVYNEI